MDEYLEINGWFNYDELYDIAVAEAPENATFVELGCYHGRSAAYMASRIRKSGKSISLFCIDIWITNHRDWYWREHGIENSLENFRNNIKKAKVDDLITPVQMDSTEAASLFKDKQCDFVFIDADHSYPNVMADIMAWWPKVKIGGILSGHDYDRKLWEPVVRAVDQLFGEGAYFPPSSWMVRKDREVI